MAGWPELGSPDLPCRQGFCWGCARTGGGGGGSSDRTPPLQLLSVHDTKEILFK